MPYFIAEVSSNHGSNLERALRFVDLAADCGFDAVKFQAFKIDQLFAPEILAKSEEHRRRKAWELPLDFLPLIKERCLVRNIDLGITPFYLDAVHECAEYVDFFKVASYELLWHDLVNECAKYDLPLYISTGMASLDEVVAAAENAKSVGIQKLTFLHCVSNYPAPASEVNLSCIQTLKDILGLEVGWSDHTLNPLVVSSACLRWGASCVELHIDIDGMGDEYASGHCWLPDNAKKLITDIRGALAFDGDGKKLPADCEQTERQWRADPSDGLRPFLWIRSEF